MKDSIAEYITPLVLNMVSSMFNNDESKAKSMFSAIKEITNLSLIPKNTSQLQIITQDEFQLILSSVNEKEIRRKADGVYYTPKEVTEFITFNAFINYIFKTNENVFEPLAAKDKLLKINTEKYKQLLSSRILDPTCGTGEFLLVAAKLKIDCLIKKEKSFSDNHILKIASSIYGNDIEQTSIEIAKLRLLFYFSEYIKEFDSIKKLSNILNTNFSLCDFVIFKRENFHLFDVIIGNPPYVEHNKLSIKPTSGFGNAYADVLVNSEQILDASGVIAFIVPLSLVSTPRMNKVRSILKQKFSKQFFLNYADRPDCLFISVHQKLTIYIGTKNSAKKQVLTSNYNYWYKSERDILFARTEIFKHKFFYNFGVPKIGNALDFSIFKKLYTKEQKKSLFYKSQQTGISVYLNMRGCFWMKAFSYNPGSKEYHEFLFDKEIQPFMLCLLNSSLFFFFWVAISDCWHITSKELNSFYVPELNESLPLFKELAKELEKELERTKVFVGTKQVEYEYKHKSCKHVIDSIDRALQNIYKLTQEEIDYIINFNLKYRMSDDK